MGLCQDMVPSSKYKEQNDCIVPVYSMAFSRLVPAFTVWLIQFFKHCTILKVQVYLKPNLEEDVLIEDTLPWRLLTRPGCPIRLKTYNQFSVADWIIPFAIQKELY